MKRIALSLCILLFLHNANQLAQSIEPGVRAPEFPRVTIITSVYKSDKFMKGFLENITRQTIFDECELIIINAASPGNEDVIIHEYMTFYPNITYVKLDQDPGLYGVWNMGIDLARSEYVTNANTDDRVVLHCYELHAQALDKYPQIDLVYSDYYTTTIPNDTLSNIPNLKHTNQPEFKPSALQSCIPGMNPMWRVSMHEKHGCFNEDFVSVGDWEMWCRAVEGGSQFKKIHAVTGLYYHNPQGLSSSTSRKNIIHREQRLVKLLYADLLNSGKKSRKIADKRKTNDKKSDRNSVKERRIKKRIPDSK